MAEARGKCTTSVARNGTWHGGLSKASYGASFTVSASDVNIATLKGLGNPSIMRRNCLAMRSLFIEISSESWVIFIKTT